MIPKAHISKEQVFDPFLILQVLQFVLLLQLVLLV